MLKTEGGRGGRGKGGREQNPINFTFYSTQTLKVLPKGSNADKAEGLPLKARPPKPSSEVVGMENAAKGSREEPNGSEEAAPPPAPADVAVLSSFEAASSAPSSR